MTLLIVPSKPDQTYCNCCPRLVDKPVKCMPLSLAGSASKQTPYIIPPLLTCWSHPSAPMFVAFCKPNDLAVETIVCWMVEIASNGIFCEPICTYHVAHWGILKLPPQLVANVTLVRGRFLRFKLLVMPMPKSLRAFKRM